MNWFLTSNDPGARVTRTIVQGIIALIPGILNFYLPYMPDWCAIVLVPVIMCILSPVMAEIGKAIDENGGSYEDNIKIGGSK